MCAAPNLTAFTYWPTVEHPNVENTIQSYANTAFIPESQKSKILRSVFFFNNLPKQEMLPGYEKTPVATELEARHFLASVHSAEYTHSDELLVKPSEVIPHETKDPNITNLINHNNKAPPNNSNNIPNGNNNNPNGNNNNGNNSEGKVRPYNCDECGKSFLLKHHLTTHARTHSGIRPHVCVHCGKAFTHKHCLNTHLLLHSSERPYQCQECKKSFTLKHHLLTHSRVHSREKPFVCTECGQAFPLKRHLITHSKFHAGERPFVCDDCGESFAHKEHLVMHSRFHGFVNSFACTDCGATFSRKFELVNHGRLHGKQPHSCPICNKEFLQKRTLIAHMRYHSGESPFSCHQCGETFQSKQDFLIHSKTHSQQQNQQQKPLICQECGCIFNTIEALALHVKLHTGDASLVNDLCALTTGLQQSNFSINITNHNNSSNNHVQSHASTIKPKNHKCQHCAKAFTAKHGLHQHNKRHPDGSCALRSHICNVCDKGFFQKNHLLLHQRQHMDPNDKNPAQTIRAIGENYSRTIDQVVSQNIVRNPVNMLETYNHSRSNNINSLSHTENNIAHHNNYNMNGMNMSSNDIKDLSNSVKSHSGHDHNSVIREDNNLRNGVVNEYKHNENVSNQNIICNLSTNNDKDVKID